MGNSIALLLPLAVLCVVPAGCESQGRAPVKAITAEEPAPRAPVQKEPPVRVALIMKTLTNPFFVEMEKGARRAQAETQVDLQVETATQETSIEQQVQLVENEIKAHARAIVIAPGDSMRLVPVLKKAQEAGIAIVNIDNRLSPDAIAASGMQPVPFISVNNEAAAYAVGKLLADKVQGPTEAAILEGIRAANNAQMRKQGAERGLRENPKVKIVASETANWKVDEAYVVTRALFRAHPGIGILFCANDMMAIGALQYLQEAGKTKVLVGGFDALEEAKVALRGGTLQATVDQQAGEQGYLGVMTALKLVKGEQTPMEIMVEGKLVTVQSMK